MGSEYNDATWKDLLRVAANECFGFDVELKQAVKNIINDFTQENLCKVLKSIPSYNYSANDEYQVNFRKLQIEDLWKIFDREERRQAFKEILCSDLSIGELCTKGNETYDIAVIIDHSINRSGDMVGWHYGASLDKDDEVNQEYINDYIEEMTK
jgi:hypothetical protein